MSSYSKVIHFISYLKFKMSLLLEHTWSAWYDYAAPNRSAEDYEQTLHQLCTINSLQDFWGCYNNMPALQTLPFKCGYHIMKNNVKPAWEDLSNRNGGVWQFKIKKESGVLLWKETLMALVSDSYKDFMPAGVDVNGISISNKQSDYFINLWITTDQENEQVVKYFLKLAAGIETSNPPVFKTCASMMHYHKSKQ